MSLITLDELAPHAKSPFKLIMLAANRAHQLAKGSVEAIKRHGITIKLLRSLKGDYSRT